MPATNARGYQPSADPQCRSRISVALACERVCANQADHPDQDVRIRNYASPVLRLYLFVNLSATACPYINRITD